VDNMPLYLQDIPKAERSILHVEQDLARLRNPAPHIARREGELAMLQSHLAELKTLAAKEETQ
jgi:hypothetical protein